MRMNCEDQPFLYNELAFHSERSEEFVVFYRTTVYEKPKKEDVFTFRTPSFHT